MPRYRNTGSMPLDYSGSGGPKVEPGEEFEHDIPPAMRDAHLEAGNITEVPPKMKPARTSTRIGDTTVTVDLGDKD